MGLLSTIGSFLPFAGAAAQSISGGGNFFDNLARNSVNNAKIAAAALGGGKLVSTSNLGGSLLPTNGQFGLPGAPNAVGGNPPFAVPNGSNSILDFLLGRTDVPGVLDPADIRQMFQNQNQFQAGQTFGALIADPVPTTVFRAPNRSMVVVTDPSSGRKLAINKKVAKALDLWKPRRKPPISAGDWNKLKTVARVEKKAKRIAKTAGFHVESDAAHARRLAKRKSKKC